MSVQLANSFTEVPAPVQSSQERTSASDGAARGREAAGDGRDFEGYLMAAKTIRGAVSEKGTPGLKKIADSVSDEDLSRLIPPLVKGLEQIKLLAESVTTELEQGSINGAMAAVSDAAAKASRFNPDLILADTPLLGAIKELFAKRGEVTASPDGLVEDETLGAETEGEQSESQMSDGLNLSADDMTPDEEPSGNKLNPDVSDKNNLNSGEPVFSSLHTPGMEIAEGRKGEDPLSADSKAKPAKAADLNDAASRNLQFLSQLAGVTQDKRSSNAVESELPELPENEGDPMLAAFKEVFAKRAEHDKESPSGQQSSSKGSDDKQSQGVSKAAKLQQSLDARKGVEHDTPRVNPQADFASMLRERQDGVRDMRGASPVPGEVYTLNQERAFGDGLTSVLQFMRTDGTQEARIVVQPPALGRIDIALHATASGVEAVFKVDNEQLKQVLQQQIDALKSSLQAQGIHVSSLAVDIKNRDDRGRGDAYANAKKVRRVGGAEGVDGEEDLPEGASLARLDLEKGLLHWLA